ncbi:uncharacterized protein LOC132903439 [Amyelois transitella]|uniref:uncharacterized protein LOC106129657 n=1 Tax=Amyelois transitella TaxID=680683 RepID=UPI00067B2836|nr:uncharacterized protein LOC106129657 [Amyelois transitella]XP_013187244.1 uncharacterized protein LOC106132393 [Amyelois transitella]XP_013189619.1 uncharacterized protein LOC106134176 [Amyelois transitella]XP_013193465.1 uncharacterized protein LOC106137212 [Amyelois transitella]XP_013197306.1 uncharacterized protein LOC106140276 [Amyelois transitella]XP_013199866.1 uncharacterized protein LOC106142596 isoform X2 [Amyelois transitella]XP_060800532.1 uncharacterized protein LOC132901747 [A
MWDEDDVLLISAAFVVIAGSLLRKPRRFWVRRGLQNRDNEDFLNRLQEDDCDVLNLEYRSNGGFKDFFKMSSSDFELLLQLIGPSINKNDTKWRTALTAKEKLGVTLRYYVSGDSFGSLMQTFKISQQSVSEIVPVVSQALITELKSFMQMPNTEEKWKNIAKGFNDKWNFPNCLGALDGKHVRIEAPFHSGTDYYNFKEYFSIVLMALVDSDYNILYANVGCQGRISDGGVFSNTILDNIETLNVPEDSELPGRPCRTPYVIITDNAFPLTERFIKPYTSLGKKGSKIRIFNYRLSRARRMVESTFGILSKVYGCFRRPFKLQPSKVTKVVMALLHLHNFLRRNDESRHLYEYYAFQGDRRNATNDVGINVGEAEETNAENANIEPIMLYNFSPGEIVRDEFAEYFCSHQGKVPWQNKY